MQVPKRVKQSVAVFTGLGVVGGVLSIWVSATPKIQAVTNRLVASAQKPTVSVEGSYGDDKDFIAVALSEQSVDLVAPSPGVITEMAVELGAEVSANTIVAKIRAEDVSRDVMEADAVAAQSAAEVARARAEVRDAENRLAARRSVDVVSVEERRSAQSRLKVALANLELAKRREDQAEARVAKAKYHDEQLTIRAPFAGFVSGKYQNPGSTVVAGTRLLRFIGTKQPMVRFAVPHQRATSFKIGDAGMFRPEVGSEGNAAPVTVVRIAPDADPHSGLVVVEASFKDASEVIRPGTVGRIEVAAK